MIKSALSRITLAVALVGASLTPVSAATWSPGDVTKAVIAGGVLAGVGVLTLVNVQNKARAQSARDHEIEEALAERNAHLAGHLDSYERDREPRAAVAPPPAAYAPAAAGWAPRYICISARNDGVCNFWELMRP